MKNDYLDVLRRFLPEEVVKQAQASCREQRKSVAFRREKGDAVHCFAMKSCQNWPKDDSSCDCLFVCSRTDRNDFLVVLVELKGDDTKKAFAQIEKTAAKLCANTGQAFDLAGHGKGGRSPGSGAYHHRGFVVAVVAAPSGGNAAPAWQVKRKQLKQKSIILLDRHPPQTVLTVKQLYRLAGIQENDT